MIKKLRNIFFLFGLIAFVISIFFSFQFKKDSLKRQAKASSQILQSLITLKHKALKKQIYQLSRAENNLQTGRGLKQSRTLSQNSIRFLALMDLKNIKNIKNFSWFVFNSSNFNLNKQNNYLLAQNIFKDTKNWLNKNQNLNNKNSKLFLTKVLNKDYFVFLTPYKTKKQSLWSLALLPKLSFASWLPMQTTNSPFRLLNSFFQTISHNNYFYIAKKSKTNWAVKQSQLGLLESQRFVYKNSDFVFQVFSKIEASSLVLSSTWELNFWSMFFKFFATFFILFFALPYFAFNIFFKKEKKTVLQDFTKKQKIVITKKPEQENKDLFFVQTPPKQSSIIKDLQSLIEDLDTKPLEKTLDELDLKAGDLKKPVSFIDKRQEL